MTRSARNPMPRCACLWALAAGACTTVEDSATSVMLGPMDCYRERGGGEEVPLDRAFVSEDQHWAMDVRDPWIYDGRLDLDDFVVTQFFARCQGEGCSDMLKVIDHTPSGDTWTRLENALEAAGYDLSETVRGWTDQGICFGQRTQVGDGWVLVERELLDGRGVRFRLELYQAQDTVDPQWLDLLDTFQVRYR